MLQTDSFDGFSQTLSFFSRFLITLNDFIYHFQDIGISETGCDLIGFIFL